MNPKDRVLPVVLYVLIAIMLVTVAASFYWVVQSQSLVKDELFAMQTNVMEKNTSLHRIIFAVHELTMVHPSLSGNGKEDSEKTENEMTAAVVSLLGHASIPEPMDAEVYAHILKDDPLLILPRVKRANKEYRTHIDRIAALYEDMLTADTIEKKVGVFDAITIESESFITTLKNFSSLLIQLEGVLYSQLKNGAQTFAGNLNALLVVLFIISSLLIVFAVIYQRSMKRIIFELERHKDRLSDMVEEKTAKLRKTLDQKEMLVREVNHRVKNNLSIISSLINLKIHSIDADIDLSDLVHQVEAVRIIHEKLYKSENISYIEFRHYIQDLLDTLFRPFKSDRIVIENTIEPLHISTKLAVPLALIVNEIATNAIKYGLPNRDRFLFYISLQRDEQSDHYTLTAGDNGAVFPESVDFTNTETLGLRLITSLVAQINGSVELRKSPSPRYTISFPMEVK